MPIRAPRKLFSFTLSASLREAWGGDLIPPVAIQERGKLDVLPICPSWGLPYLPVPTPCPSSCADTPIPSASLSSVGDGTGQGGCLQKGLLKGTVPYMVQGRAWRPWVTREEDLEWMVLGVPSALDQGREEVREISANSLGDRDCC